VKEELEYFKEDLHHLHIFQEPELNFKEFDDRIKNLIQNKCIPLLGTDAAKVEEPAANGENAQLESENYPAKNDDEEEPIEITQPNGGTNGETVHQEEPVAVKEEENIQEDKPQEQEVVQEEEAKEEVQEEAVVNGEEENVQEEKPQEEEEKPQEQEIVQEEEEAKEEIQEEKNEEAAVEEVGENKTEDLI